MVAPRLSLLLVMAAMTCLAIFGTAEGAFAPSTMSAAGGDKCADVDGGASNPDVEVNPDECTGGSAY